MLLNVGFALHNIGIIMLLLCGVIVLKAVFTFGAAVLLRYPFRINILVALGLAQIGEFSFILSKVGMQFNLLDFNMYQVFLAVAVLSMMLTPLLMALGQLGEKWKAGKSVKPALQQTEDGGGPVLSDHLIIIGFGLNGRNLARAAAAAGIPYIIFDLNPDTVARERKNGLPIFYGDAAQPEVLHLAGIEQARVLVIAINDPAAVRRMTRLSHEMNTNVHIIVRTRYVKEVEALLKLGADEVIPEEFETAVEIFHRVLKKYLTSRATIDLLTSEIRADGYRMLRLPEAQKGDDASRKISELEISRILVPEGAFIIEKTLRQLQLRQQHHLNLLVVFRGEEVLAHPDGATRFLAGDELLVLGATGEVAAFREKLQKPETAG